MEKRSTPFPEIPSDLETLISVPPNDISRRKDLAKGNVRLRWNHKISTNISKYRIDKLATTTLVLRQEEPNPICLSVEQLRRKI